MALAESISRVRPRRTMGFL